MTVWQAMSKLESIGYSFVQDRDSLKAAIIGTPPPEASALLDIVRADRDAAADYIRQRKSGSTVIDDGCTYSVFDALAIGQAVQRGEAVLLAPVVFHVEPVNVSVYWKPTHGVPDAVLEWHRERLKKALRRRLQEMEQKDLDGMTEAEIDRFCQKYDRYKIIMEGCV